MIPSSPAHRRVLLWGLVLGLALGVLISVGARRVLRPERMVMTDQPCPARAAGAVREPVRGDLAGLCNYRPENAALLAAGMRPRVVFIGDSLTEEWAAEDPELFRGGVAGRGIGGQTSQQVLLRFRQDVIALRPQAVHIAVGTNDIAANSGINRPQDLADNVETMIDLAGAHGIRVIVASMFPADVVPARREIEGVPARIAQLDGLLRALAARRGVVFADYRSALADSRGRPLPGLTHDGLHLTKAGYAAIRPVAEQAMATALSAAPPARSSAIKP